MRRVIRDQNIEADTLACRSVRATAVKTDNLKVSGALPDGLVPISNGTVPLVAKNGADIDDPPAGDNTIYFNTSGKFVVRNSAGSAEVVPPTLGQVIDTSADAGGNSFTNVDSVVFAEAASKPSPGAGAGTLYVKNTTPSTLAFVDDTGTESEVGAAQPLADVLLAGNSAGATDIDLNGNDLVDAEHVVMGDASTGVQIGTGSVATDRTSVAIGNNASTGAFGPCVALGTNATCLGNRSIALNGRAGPGSIAVLGECEGADNIAIGDGSECAPSVTSSVVLGKGAQALSGTRNLAIGFNAIAKQTALAMGRDAYAAGVEGIAIGRGAMSYDGTSYSIAIGSFAKAKHTNSCAVGALVETRVGGAGIAEAALPGFRVVKGTTTTSAVTPVVLVSFPLITDEAVVVHADVMELDTVASTTAVHFRRNYHVRNQAGVVTIIAGTTDVSDPSAIGSSIALAVDGTSVELSATPASTNSTNWTGVLTVFGAGLA